MGQGLESLHPLLQHTYARAAAEIFLHCAPFIGSKNRTEEQDRLVEWRSWPANQVIAWWQKRTAGRGGRLHAKRHLRRLTNSRAGPSRYQSPIGSDWAPPISGDSPSPAPLAATQPLRETGDPPSSRSPPAQKRSGSAPRGKRTRTDGACRGGVSKQRRQGHLDAWLGRAAGGNLGGRGGHTRNTNSITRQPVADLVGSRGVGGTGTQRTLDYWMRGGGSATGGKRLTGTPAQEGEPAHKIRRRSTGGRGRRGGPARRGRGGHTEWR